jgi:tryptophan synthase alpha chain
MAMTMNRMDRIFGKMMKAGDKILVTNFPIGDTILGNSVEWGKKYFDNGSDVLEIVLPYENPALDGSIVRDSMKRALSNTTLEKIFVTIAELRKRHTDNVLQIMTYFEIIDRYGIKEFAGICDECGVDAVLTPNAPGELLSEIDDALGNYGIYNTRFAPFHLNDMVIDDLKKNAAGYVFLQAVDGATGPQEKVSPKIAENVRTLKGAGLTTPIIAGFGISNPDQVKEVISMGADGVVVGSSLIKNISDGNGEAFLKALQDATR